MRKKLRRVLVGSLGVTICVALVLLAIDRTMQQVPPFYAEALAVDATTLEQASDEMGSRATALVSDAREAGQWNAVFTADQINGWLAVDLIRLHAGDLPEGISDLRIAVHPDRITVGFRVERDGSSIVYSVEVDMYVSEPNVIACRLRRARAGRLPLPIGKVIDTVTKAARRVDLPLRWAQTGGDPVALVTLFPDREDKLGTTLRTLELLDGEIYVAGTTDPAEKTPAPGVETSEQSDVARQPAE